MDGILGITNVFCQNLSLTTSLHGRIHSYGAEPGKRRCSRVNRLWFLMCSCLNRLPAGEFDRQKVTSQVSLGPIIEPHEYEFKLPLRVACIFRCMVGAEHLRSWSAVPETGILACQHSPALVAIPKYQLLTCHGQPWTRRKNPIWKAEKYRRTVVAVRPHCCQSQRNQPHPLPARGVLPNFFPLFAEVPPRCSTSSWVSIGKVMDVRAGLGEEVRGDSLVWRLHMRQSQDRNPWIIMFSDNLIRIWGVKSPRTFHLILYWKQPIGEMGVARLANSQSSDGLPI